MNPFIENLDEYESTEELEELKSYYEDCLEKLNSMKSDISLPSGSQSNQSLETMNSAIDIMKEKLEDELDGLEKLLELVYDHLDQDDDTEDEKIVQARRNHEFLDWLRRSGRR